MTAKPPASQRHALRPLIGPVSMGVVAALVGGLYRLGIVIPNSGMVVMVVVMGLAITESTWGLVINMVFGLGTTLALMALVHGTPAGMEPVQTVVATLAFVVGTVIVFLLRRRLERASARPVQSERSLFQAVMTGMHDAIVETDWKGIRDVNDSFCRMTGFTREELIGKTSPYPFWPVEQYAAIATALETAMRGGALDFELVLNRKGGERFPVLLSVSRVLDGAAPNRVLYSFRDITELKKAQEEARSSARTLQHAVEGADMGVWDWDLATDRVVWSGHHERMWGMRPGEFTGNLAQAWNRIHPDDSERVKGTIEAALAARRSFHTEFRLVWPDGSVHWIASTGSHMFDAQGKAVRVSGVAQDVTERRQSQRMLEAEGVILKEIATGATLETTLLSLVQMIEGMLAGSRCSIMSLDAGTGQLQMEAGPHLPEEYRGLVEGVVVGPEVGTCGRAAAINERVVTEDIQTDPRWAAWRDVAATMRLRSCIAEPIRARDGRVLGTFAIYHYERGNGGIRAEQLRMLGYAAQLAGIAIERAREQEELAQARDAMKGSEENARGFVRAVAAELRTPLSPIVRLAAALEVDPRVAGLLRAEMQVIRLNAETLAGMVEELERMAEELGR